MVERPNRRELIVETAARLFEQQGYTATSVRQIADEVGCTEAALYYHFKEGKRELLGQVVECDFPNLEVVLEECRQAKTLHELILMYGQAMVEIAPPRLEKMRWLQAEFPNFSEEEKQFVQDKHLHFHQLMTDLIAQFVEPEAANRLAWVMQCSGLGYGMLFWTFGLNSRVELSNDEMITAMADLLAGHA
jgi:AcrR family transcriptional regulator